METEAAAVSQLASRIDASFSQACESMLNCQGRVVATGMGKSGHIANKIAATLASTGTPAFFMHPGEASHGDLGMITSEDVVLALSNSGETDEILRLLPLLKRLGIVLIAMTGNPQSTLAQQADVHLNVAVEKEACPLGLAPTASTTAALVMGDALAVALLNDRGFTEADFALSHPGGSLGRKLLLRVADIMRSGEQLPVLAEQASMREVLLEISRKGMGMAILLDSEQHLAGVFTDGDLRRLLDHEADLFNLQISEIMTRNCQTIDSEQIATEAVQKMQSFRINALVVCDAEQHVIGALNMHDLLQAGVV